MPLRTSMVSWSLCLISLSCATPAREAPPVADFGPSGLATIEPPLPELERGMMDHADRFGFSLDSREFGYCMTDGGAGATRCGFLDDAGKLTTLSDFSRVTGEPDPTLTQTLEQRMAADQAPPGTWRFARDLVLVWQVTGAHDPGSAASGEQGPPVLRVGARVRSAKLAALPIVIQAGPNAYTIHPEAVALSPDGGRVVVLSHDFGGEFSDHFEVKGVSSAALAQEAYTVAADERERSGDAEGAARLRRFAAESGATRSREMELQR